MGRDTLNSETPQKQTETNKDRAGGWELTASKMKLPMEQIDESVLAQSRSYMVFLLDILGFEARFAEEGLQSTLATYRKLTSYVDELSGQLIFDVRPSGNPGIGTLFSGYVELEHVYFSDTILLWTPLSPMSARHFLSHCNRLVCHALTQGIMVRGAISAGEAVLDKEKSIFLGAPIIEAARLEHAQDWIGVTLGESFMRALNGYPCPWDQIFLFSKHIKEEWKTTGYFKDHPAFVLNWAKDWPEDAKAAADTISFYAQSADSASSNKYKLTLEFLSFLEKHANWTERNDGFSLVYQDLTGRVPTIENNR